MKYDVIINQQKRQSLSYAALIALPLTPDTLVRREGGEGWIRVSECIELAHVMASAGHSKETAQNPPPVCVENTQNGASNPSVSPSGTFVGGRSTQTHSHRPTPQQPTQQRTARPQSSVAAYPYQASQPYQPSHYTSQPSRVFVPSTEYFKCRQKRKAAIIGLCTLGLAGITLIGVGEMWRSNIFEGTSFAAGGIGFVFKCLSFVFLTALVAIPYFIYSFFALIYYSIRMHNLKAR